jgi:hypothetical protein
VNANVGVCRLCGQLRPLIKAHAIPRSFFKNLKGTAKYSVLFDANAPLNKVSTFYQAGIYDSGILCIDCEKKFNNLDTYGWEILGNPLLINPVYDASAGGYSYTVNCDTDKIRRFILAILWRASVSSHSFYSEVKLGPYESQVKRRLFYPTALRPNEFLTVVMRLDMQALGPYKDVLFYPFKGGRDGLNIHTLFLPNGLKIMVVTGRGKFAPIFQHYSIRDPKSFLLIDCPEQFMREKNYIPAAIAKMRRRAHLDLNV